MLLFIRTLVVTTFTIFLLTFFINPHTAVAANIMYEETFEGSTFLTTFSKQNATPYALTQITNPVFQGSKAARFELRDTDPLDNEGTRTEVSYPRETGTVTERWYTYTAYFPSEYYKIDTQDEVIMQWHQSGGFSPPLSMRTRDDRFQFLVKPTPSTTQRFDLGLIPKDQWITFVFHHKFSDGADGLTEIWMNGNKVFNRTGDNIYTTADSSTVKSPTNWKFGLYKSDWNGSQTTDATLRIFYVDNVRIGNENATYADMVTTGTAVVNIPPIVNAGADQTITLPVATINLQGNTADTDGIGSFKWTQISGPSTPSIPVSTYVPTITGLVQGTYTFRLTVTDSKGASSSDDVVVTVKPILTPPSTGTETVTGTSGTVSNTVVITDVTSPVVTILTPAANGAVSNTVAITASATDESGIVGVQFKIDGVNIDSEEESLPYSINWNTNLVSNGAHTVSAVARDKTGNTTSKSIIVNVNNVIPTGTFTVNAGTDQVITLPTSKVVLTGTATDPIGISTYKWTKVIDGLGTMTNTSLPTASVDGLRAGTYVFRLTVTNKNQITAYDEVTVVVNNTDSALHTTPVAGAGVSVGSRIEVTTVLLKVRQTPTMSGLVVTTVPKGTKGTVIAFYKSWMKVRFDSGIEGYVYNKYISKI